MEPINDIKNKDCSHINNKTDNSEKVNEVISRWTALQKIIKEEITLEEISNF